MEITWKCPYKASGIKGICPYLVDVSLNNVYYLRENVQRWYDARLQLF